MGVGVEWLVDAAGCDPGVLSDSKLIVEFCGEILSDLNLSVIGEPAVHKFAGAGGLTAFFLLTESHLACHTYPENGVATFNLYCCRERPEWPWKSRIEARLGANRVTVTRVDRGIALAAGYGSNAGCTANQGGSL